MGEGQGGGKGQGRGKGGERRKGGTRKGEGEGKGRGTVEGACCHARVVEWGMLLFWVLVVGGGVLVTIC